MQNTVIHTEHLGKIFKRALKQKFIALKDLSLDIERGEVFGFLGPNGAGKTTTIKILVNLIFPTSGNAWILNKPCSDPKSRKHIGYLPEMSSLFDFLTFEEILHFAGRTQGMNKADIRKRTDELAETLDMVGTKKVRIRKFSKGMQQRTGLAYALIGNPDVLILDEPMSGLDPIGRKDFVDLINRLKGEGKTIFFSSHVLSDIENVCDRVGILVKGQLKKVGKISEMLHASSDDVCIKISKLDGQSKDCFEKISATMQMDNSTSNICVSKDKLDVTMGMIKKLDAKIVSIDTKRKTLEDVFLEVVNGNS